jgi:predicted kinase
MIIIPRGVPGCGKSTWLAKHYPDAVTVSADHYFTRMDGTYRYDKAKASMAHDWCLRQFIETVRRDIRTTIAVDNTNVFAVDIAPYVKIGQAYGHDHRIVTLVVDEGLAFERNIHKVPLEDVIRLGHHLRQESLPSFWKTEILDGEATRPGTPRSLQSQEGR